MNTQPADGPGSRFTAPVATLVHEIRLRYPKESALYTDTQLSEMVRQSVDAGELLHIDDKADVFRAVALCILITGEQRKSPLILGALVRIITNLNWSGTKRLDFIYKHLVNRPISPNEPDFGTPFVPGKPGVSSHLP